MDKTTQFARAAMTLLFAVLTSFMAVSTGFAADGVPTKGSCGPSDKPEAVLWEFDMSTQTLTISGEGDMADFESPANAPWYSWCSDITSVVVANGVTSVSRYAFSSDYWQLENISLASTIVNIGDYAFCDAPLKSIQQIKTESATRKKDGGADEPVASFLPDNLQIIGKYALSNTKITSLTIPSLVNTIGEGALANNSKLTTLTVLGTMLMPGFEGDILEGCTALTAIYVPETVVEDYKNNTLWQRYASLIQAAPKQGEEPGGGGEGGSASGTVTIGEDKEGSADLPISASHSYVLTQQIFTADQINHAKGKIWSLGFNVETGDLTRNLAIYITTTDQTWLSSSEWQAVTDADCVYNGEVTFATGKWATVYFDKPFEYDGKSNLIITVDDNTGKSSGSWGVLSCHTIKGSHIYAYSESKDLDPKDVATIEKASYKSSVSYQSQIQFTFGDYPTPGNPAVTEIGDVSAKVQCSLRGEAKAWNLRYRKVAGEGEEEQRYVAQNDITTSPFTIEGLTANTKYEAQVQAVFAAKEEGGEDILSDWTSPLVFTTNCCPVDQQADIIYAVNSNYSNWHGYAIQFMDITDENNPVEAAYINPVDYSFTGGKLTLCCGHKYKVNWIFDENHSNVNGSFSLALYFEPGDKFFSMPMGTAPTETAELTTFVMDCTPYCAQMPQILNEAGTTYESATITFTSQTKSGQVVYSTEADFDPDKATPEDMDFEELPTSNVPWEQPNASFTLKGLQPLTAYYVRVRSVCTAEPLGTSRWSEPIKVITGSRYDGPSNVTAEPVDSRTEKISWKNGGSSSKANIYYRAKVEGSPVNPDDIQTIGGGNGSGFTKNGWGEGIWSSGDNNPYSNILYVGGVGGNTTYSFLAGQGKTGMSGEKFLYGMVEQTEATPLEQMRKLDRECLNDADRAARIKDLKKNINDIQDRINTFYNLMTNPSLTDEQKAELEKQIADHETELAELQSELETLESLPTDDEKLKQMKELEGYLKDDERMMNELMDWLEKGKITEEEYDEQMKVLNEDYYKKDRELSNLRATTSAAENVYRDGFSITPEVPSGADTELPKSRALTRAGEDAKYVFFIRHSNGNGVLLVKDLTITPNDKLNEWKVIPNVSGTSYTLTDLDPSTTYEVMVEAVQESGAKGARSPIATFTTIGAETDPVDGVFAVSKDKKVSFAKGNLRYEGDIYGYESEWSMAKQQYEVLGEENINYQGDWSFPKYPTDLLCWSTTNNYYGVSTYYWNEPDEIKEKFKGDFVDWGTNPILISQLGAGWRTLSSDEWKYLLTERDNAAQLNAFATIAISEETKVKGLVILPDEWNAPDGVMLSEEMTIAQWTAIEETGAVFLPVTGHLWTWKDEQGNDQASVNGLDVIGNYWTSTPSAEESGDFACALNFNTEVVPGAEIERNLGCAVRLVKEVELYEIGDANGDGKIDAEDIVEITNFIEGTPSEKFKGLKFADVNKDGVVNIADIVMLTNMLFRSADNQGEQP